AESVRGRTRPEITLRPPDFKTCLPWAAFRNAGCSEAVLGTIKANRRKPFAHDRVDASRNHREDVASLRPIHGRLPAHSCAHFFCSFFCSSERSSSPPLSLIPRGCS